MTYGLGSEASSLPAYVVMTDCARRAARRTATTGAPASCRRRTRARSFRSTGDPIVDLKPPAGVTADDQRARLDALAKLNELDMQKYPGNSELAARISSYELAYRMQGCAPTRVDVGKRVGSDEEAVRPRQHGHRAVRPAVPDGAAAGRARRAVRADLSRRHGQPERRHLGRARRHQGRITRSTPPNPICRSPGC